MSVATNNSQLIALVRPYAEMVDVKLREHLAKMNAPKQLLEAMRYAVLAGGKHAGEPVLTAG